MRTRYLLFIILICSTLASYNQTTYFRNFYHITNDSSDNERASCCVETNNGYLVAGFSYAEYGYNSVDKMVLFETDPSGNVLWAKQHIVDTMNCTSSFISFLQGEDSTYDCFITKLDTLNYRYRPVLVRFNRSGEVILSKVMYDPALTDPQMYISGKAIRTSDGGSLLCCGSGGKIVTLFKFNRELEMEWKQPLGQSNHYNNLGNLIQLPDSSYIAGMTFMFQWDGDARVLHLTKNGVTDWIANIDGPLLDAYCHVIQDYDSAFLAVSTYTTKITHYGDIQEARFQVSKIKPDGQVIWRKQIGPITYLPGISSLIRLPDSTYVFSGTSGAMHNSYMFRINRNGDSLLYKTLDTIAPTIIGQYLVNSISTSDDGLLFNGQVFIYDALYGAPERFWLIKTDTYGCDFFGCDSTNLYILDQTTERTICKGDNTWFGVEARGADANYQWQVKSPGGWWNLYDDNMYSGTQTDTLFLNNSTVLTGNMTYRCRVSNQSWQLYSSDIQLSYKESPSFILQPVNVSVTEGSYTEFITEVSGIEEPILQWYFNDSEIEGADSNVYVISTVQLSDSGYYYCKAMNNCGIVTSDSALLTVQSNGIGDIPSQSGLCIYPNPAGTVLCIEPLHPTGEIDGMIYIMDTKGEILDEQKTTGKINRIDVSELPSGLYFISLRNSKVVEMGKFLKR